MCRGPFINLLFSIFFLLNGGTQVLAETAPAITVELPFVIHFLTPAGDDVEVGPGRYEVEVAESWLKLVPEAEGPASAVLLEATSGTHEENVTETTVRLEGDPDNSDVFHLAMLLQDGTGLEAVGTASGIFPRGLQMVYLNKAVESSNTQITKSTIGTLSINLAAPKPCDNEKIERVRAKASSKGDEEKIDCQLTLRKEWTITKRLVFEGAKATGLTLDCQGATIGDGTNTDKIQVRSRKYKNNPTDEQEPWKWERPENVTIKNCHIIGSIRVWGMSTNGEGNPKEYVEKQVCSPFQTPNCRTVKVEKPGSNELKNSSRKSGHTQRVQANAPTNIVFDHVHITGLGRNPFYLAPGVTHVQLINSKMEGKSSQVAIYLDAESARNIIKNNDIAVATGNRPFEKWDRPLIAIDGSAHNFIQNNRFSNLSHGGIYLYRNCGEGGVVRHQPPSHNVIVNNIFYYNKYTGGNPSVYLGSRDRGGFFQDTFGFCEDDAGVPFGSSASDKDYARHNVIMQNQIYKRSITDMIKTNNTKVNSPNYIDHNQTVTDQTLVRNRLAGCYLPNNSPNLLAHGRSLELIKDTGKTACFSRYSCTDGVLNRPSVSDCRIKKIAFDCQVSGNNRGCQKVIACPTGKKLLGAKAACNLESGTISPEVMTGLSPNLIKVIRASDTTSAGSCHVGFNKLQIGQKGITSIKGFPSVEVGCKEHDKNGGDCHIKGVLYCK